MYNVVYFCILTLWCPKLCTHQSELGIGIAPCGISATSFHPLSCPKFHLFFKRFPSLFEKKCTYVRTCVVSANAPRPNLSHLIHSILSSKLVHVICKVWIDATHGLLCTWKCHISIRVLHYNPQSTHNKEYKVNGQSLDCTQGSGKCRAEPL